MSLKDSREVREFSPKQSEVLILDKTSGPPTTCRGQLARARVVCDLKIPNRRTSNSGILFLIRDSTQEIWRVLRKLKPTW